MIEEWVIAIGLVVIPFMGAGMSGLPQLRYTPSPDKDFHNAEIHGAG